VKGGEFPIVFLPFLRSSSFPLSFRKQKIINKPPDDWLKYIQATDLTDKEHHLQEERRLFYVAITRAKEQLYLLTPKKATSKLVKELPDHLIEDQNMNIPSDKKNQTYSNLRVKYENLIQNALTEENYNEVINMSKALKAIKKHENGEKLNLGNQNWEKILIKELKKPYKPDVPEIIFLSASAIETYKTCPLKFRFSRIDKLPQNAKKPQLIFGNIIHKVLQRFHEPNKEITSNRIIRLLNEEWKKDDFDYRVREEKFKEQGIKILKKYVENVTKNIPEVIKTEENFSFDIGPITIRGAIDRIDKNIEGIEIIDYKTSKTPSSAKNSLQLAIYSMYLEQLEDPDLGGIPLKSSFYFLRNTDDPIKSHTFTKDQIAESKEIIIDVAAGIRSKHFDPNTGMHCDWCDYKALACPAWEKD
jgi:DNA helicase-2/ATP-dependent DNA helicase PcrA